MPKVKVRPVLDIDFKALRARMQHIMSENCFVIRTEEGLETAFLEMRKILDMLLAGFSPAKEYDEDLSLAIISESIIMSALARRESIGAHYRES